MNVISGRIAKAGDVPYLITILGNYLLTDRDIPHDMNGLLASADISESREKADEVMQLYPHLRLMGEASLRLNSVV